MWPTTDVDWGTNTDRGTASGHWEGNSANSTERITKEQSREFLLNVTAENALVSCSIAEHSFQLDFIAWQDIGSCNASEGRKGSVKQVLKLGEKIIRERNNGTCFNELVNGL